MPAQQQPSSTSTPHQPRPQARHPGPPDPLRLISLAGAGRQTNITLTAGSNLRDAICTALAAAGIEGATVRIEQLQVTPLHYLMPALSPDNQHAAFYSAPQMAAHAQIEFACATVGRRDGLPFVHCHAIWRDAAGTLCGGHLLCEQTILSAPVQAQVYGLSHAGMETRFDPETNFTLFHPVALAGEAGKSAPIPGTARTVLARIRPNQDLHKAIEEICRQHQLRHAIVRGSVGSIVGAVFADGHVVDDLATEILIRAGRVDETGDGWRAVLDIALIDPQGKVYQGLLARGQNPVLICFELVLEEVLD